MPAAAPWPWCTLELREALAGQILWNTLLRQAALVLVVALAVLLVVQRATSPVRALSSALQSRAVGDLGPLPEDSAPRELQPLVDTTHHVRCSAWGTCCATRSVLCATPRTCCARLWRCSRPSAVGAARRRAGTAGAGRN